MSKTDTRKWTLEELESLKQSWGDLGFPNVDDEEAQAARAACRLDQIKELAVYQKEDCEESIERNKRRARWMFVLSSVLLGIWVILGIYLDSFVKASGSVIFAGLCLMDAVGCQELAKGLKIGFFRGQNYERLSRSATEMEHVLTGE
ncbi:MAG: hypothetical protein ABIH23_15755 [bacterium]